MHILRKITGLLLVSLSQVIQSKSHSFFQFSSQPFSYDRTKETSCRRHFPNIFLLLWVTYRVFLSLFIAELLSGVHVGMPEVRTLAKWVGFWLPNAGRNWRKKNWDPGTISRENKQQDKNQSCLTSWQLCMLYLLFGFLLHWQGWQPTCTHV